MIHFLRHPRAARGADGRLSLRDWKRALKETKNALTTGNISLLAAGTAYFSTLAFFPLMAASVAIAGFVISPDQVHATAQNLESYLPADIASLVTTQLTNVAGKPASNIAIAIFAILLSLFSVSGAVQNLITATNISYDVPETRNFFKLKLRSLLFTLGTMLLGLVVIGILAMSEPNLRLIHVPEVAAVTISYARWVLLALLVLTTLSVFYHYGPNRKEKAWHWLSWGAVIATILWLLGTMLFFIYAQYFANFSKSYSLFAGIIVLMTWFNLSGLIVLLGAQINHRMELPAGAKKLSPLRAFLAKFHKATRRNSA
jgi:membrane protein